MRLVLVPCKASLVPALGRLAVIALLALVTPLTLLGTYALAWNEPDGFRGVPWGSSREELRLHFQQAGDDVTCVATALGCNSPRLSIGPVPVRAFYLFTPGADKFEVALLTFASTHYAALRTIFQERYGAPSNVREKPLQDRTGATVTNETALWVGERVTISLSRYGSKLDQGRAWIGLKAALDRHIEESQKALKKGKDDL